MGVTYQSIQWNQHKKSYDKILWLGILLALISFAIADFIFHPTVTLETMIIRSTALTAFVMLHVILLIGPLCRLDSRFLPLLYNRRHLGVSMFLIALIHGVFCIIQFHALGDTNPIASVFVSNQNYRDISDFPFQILGFFALVILMIMAATSHDFWLKNLSPKIWKSLHMLVYIAYGLIVCHVALGTLLYEDNPVYWIFIIIGFLSISGLHLYTGIVEVFRLKSQKEALVSDNYYEVADINDIDDSCAKTIFVDGENIAVFLYDGKVSAVHNVCKHQMGPLGEGRIIDGCITCPWHGYQYMPENGQSPPPFKEKVKTYNVKVVGTKVWVNINPNKEGEHTEPAFI